MMPSAAILISPIANSVPDFRGAVYIGVDAGAFKIMEAGYEVYAAIGDFDSLKAERKIESDRVIRYPIRKDTTDMESAIEFAVEQGFKRIIVWGAMARRLDHTLANISLMINRWPQIILQDEMQRLSVIKKGSRQFENDYLHVSFLPLEESCITLKGFEYPLDHKILYIGDIYTVSNHVSLSGKVELDFGAVLCIESNYE